MFQNKIFFNFSLEILKIFLTVLFGLSMIALTVRAVNFLDLIVDNGYSILAYFQYSLLNLLGISVKFIPFHTGMLGSLDQGVCSGGELVCFGPNHVSEEWPM